MSSESTRPPALRASAVTKRFGKTEAVHDLSLSIPPGTAMGFIGQNGAGKTTTIRMLMGLLRRDAGEIAVLGFDPAVDGLAVKTRVGYVPEQQFIHRWMRVREAIAFTRTFYPTWNDARCRELLQLFRLDPDKKVKALSKGMTVKLALLLALSHEPDVLILDEPMAGLDPVAREELLDGVLRTVCDRERTLLFSSHTLADVQRMADRVAIIHEGRLIVDSSVDALLSGTKRLRAVLPDGVMPSAPPQGVIWQRVDGREWLLTVDGFTDAIVPRLRAANRIDRVDVLDLGLEDIFKDYVRGRMAPC